MTTTVTVQSIIDGGRLSALQWTVFVLGCLIILADGLDAGAIGYIAPSVMEEWGIDKKDLGPVLSAALIGMSLGALGSGPLADRFGRRWVVIATTFLFGIAMLLSATSQNLGHLEIWRFLTGLGLGAAMPNIATLLAEYMPKKRRMLMVNMMLCMFPLGASLGGVLSAVLLKHFGWHAILIIGGVLPIALVLVLLFALPESVPFLLRQGRQDAARKIIAKLGRTLADDEELTLVEDAGKAQPATTGKPLKMLLSGAYLKTGITMWLCCFMSLLVFYLLMSWMPTILKNAGFGVEQYSLLTAVFPFGGVVGTLIIGWFMDRFNPNRAVMVTYFISSLLLLVTGLFGSSVYLLGGFIFLAGAGLVGAQSSLPSLAAASYPVQCRAAGVSWMHGIGRLGAITGALFGSVIFAFGLDIQGIFMLLAAPVLVSALALWAKGTETVD